MSKNIKLKYEEKDDSNPDYELPEYFEYNENIIYSKFIIDYILCEYSFKREEYSIKQNLKIPYFAIDEIIDKGNHIVIKLYDNISQYNSIFHKLETDKPILIYFEYEVDKLAVIQHFKTLKRFLNL